MTTIWCSLKVIRHIPKIQKPSARTFVPPTGEFGFSFLHFGSGRCFPPPMLLSITCYRL